MRVGLRNALLILSLACLLPAASFLRAAPAGTADYDAAQAGIEKLVDEGAVKIHGTIVRVVYSIAAEDQAYLVRIDSADKKSEQGRVIMIAQGEKGKLAGQPWPSAGQRAVVYRVGTSPYDTGGGKKAVVPLYVPDRDAAVIWALSQ
jgi:hypothetical protein